MLLWTNAADNPSAGIAEPNRPHLEEAYAKLPLSFEPNYGQADLEVKFLARGPGYTLFLTPAEAVLALGQSPSRAMLRMKMVGANPMPPIVGLALLAEITAVTQPLPAEAAVGAGSLRYRYRDPSGQLRECRVAYDGGWEKPGDLVTVLADPDNPKRHVVLRTSFYRILKDPATYP